MVAFSGSRSSTIASPGGPLGLNLSPPAAMFLAAFSSLSSMAPQCGHHSRRWVLSRVLYPHIEQSFGSVPGRNVDYLQSFPSRLVLYLSLQLSIAPTVHPRPIVSALGIAFAIEPPYASQSLQDYSIPSCLGLVNYSLGDNVNHRLHSVLVPLTILREDLSR